MKTKFEFPVIPNSVSIVDRMTGKGRQIKCCVGLSSFPFGQISDNPNPRTHECQEKLKKSKTASGIRSTLLKEPKRMSDRNKGICVSAHDDTIVDVKKWILTLWLDVAEDSRLHGILDGGTTDMVIAQELKRLHEEDNSKLLNEIAKGSVNLEILTGIKTQDELADISVAHNSTMPQKMQSIINLRGGFDSFKEILSPKFSEAKGGTPGVIAYEENANGLVSIADVVCTFHLFHPVYASGETHPDASVAGPRRVMKALDGDEKMIEGYKQLKPIMLDLLSLRDYVFSTMPETYARSGKNSKKKRPGCVFDSYKRPKVLHFSEYTATREIPVAILYPLLASLRNLLKFNKQGVPSWICDPKEFWDKYGYRLVSEAFNMMGSQSGSKEKRQLADVSNFGKTIQNWIVLYKSVQLIVSKLVADVAA